MILAVKGSGMDSLLESSRSFSWLSLKDFIEERDLFHYRIINKRKPHSSPRTLFDS